MPLLEKTRLNRRTVLTGLGFSLFLAATTALTTPLLAQEHDSGVAFDFDNFSARLEAMAAEPYAPVNVEIPAGFESLDYDA